MEIQTHPSLAEEHTGYLQTIPHVFGNEFLKVTELLEYVQKKSMKMMIELEHVPCGDRL